MSAQAAPPLDGRIALVTGASSGIGRAVARTLADAGAAVALSARRAERLVELRDEIEGGGGTAIVAPGDATSREAARSVVEHTRSELGPVDILVANAGIMTLTPIEENDVEAWTRMIDVNVKGVLHFVSAVLPEMIERERGHLLTIGSLAGRRPFPGGAVYSATKFAVRALGWGMHLELGHRYGIRVTDVQPGFATTELLDSQPEAKAAWEDSWSGRRTLQPEDVARAVEFAVTAPDHVSVSEVLVRPVDQPS